jgi:integrase
VKAINKRDADEIYRRLPKPSKLIFAVGMETGLRISDILRLKIGDVRQPLQVYVGRIGRGVACPISDWLYNELAACATSWNADHYLFISRRKWRRPLHRTTYHRDIKRAIQGTGISCSAHSTRKLYLAT